MSIAFFFMFNSCVKKSDINDNGKEINNQVPESTLSNADSLATVFMHKEVSFISLALDSMLHGNKHNRHHWDSLYRHHDSLFWHHHQKYHHSANLHDDHTHHWRPYDSTIHHNTHYHHIYDSKHHDSLVTVSNKHHDVHTKDHHHFNGHHIVHHHVIDSLRREYEKHR